MSCKNHKVIMGIETSCDDTAIAIVNSKKDILSNIVINQNTNLSKYGVSVNVSIIDLIKYIHAPQIPIRIADKSNKQKPKNSIPIFNATNKEYKIAVITPAHSKNLLFILFD